MITAYDDLKMKVDANKEIVEENLLKIIRICDQQVKEKEALPVNDNQSEQEKLPEPVITHESTDQTEDENLELLRRAAVSTMPSDADKIEKPSNESLSQIDSEFRVPINPQLRSALTSTPVARSESDNSAIDNQSVNEGAYAEVTNGTAMPTLTQMVRFQRFSKTLTRDMDFNVFRTRLISEVKAQGCEFIFNPKRKIPPGLSSIEVDRRTNLVRNYIIQSISDELCTLVQKIEHPMEILNQLESIFDPRGHNAKYELFSELHKMYYDKNAETAIAFNTRFTSLVDKIRRITEISEDEVKRNYLFAVATNCPAIQQEDSYAERVDKRGLNLLTMMDRLVSEERKNLEFDRREKENKSGAALSITKSPVKPKPVKEKGSFSRNSSPGSHSRNSSPPGKKTTGCTKCGHSTDGHTNSNCPHAGKRFCYGCREYVRDPSHIRATCPHVAKEKKEKRRPIRKESELEKREQESRRKTRKDAVM